MMLENQGQMIKYLLIIVGVFVVLMAIYFIVGLVNDYQKDKKKLRKLIEDKENMMRVDVEDDSMQLAYAGCGEVTPTQRQSYEENNSYYQSVSTSGHFTDTGRSQMRGGYANELDECSDKNFVIIKSVICTETREELK